MVNYNIINKLPRRITAIYHELKSTTYKLQRSASSVGFIKQALFHEITFAKVKGQFINIGDKKKCERSILISHLQKHNKDIAALSNKHQILQSTLIHESGRILYNIITKNMYISLSKKNTDQLRCKRKKITKLTPSKQSRYNIPVINLSSHEIKTEGLKYGLHHSFVDKNKYVKQNIAVELEYLANRVNGQVEDFHNFLHSSVNIISSNIFSSKDDTFSKLRDIRNNDGIVLLSGDKDSLTVIMGKTDYIQKTEYLLNRGIEDGKYVESEDNTLIDLHNFQTFLYRNFKKQLKSDDYDKVYPSSHQPGRFFVTAKT